MKYTRKQLIEKIKENNVEFFYEISQHMSECDNQFETKWDISYGDGNDWFIALEFPDEALTVLLTMIFSSWSEPSFVSVSQAIPYTFTETRYKPVSLQELRDYKIKDILDESADKVK